MPEQKATKMCHGMRIFRALIVSLLATVILCAAFLAIRAQTSLRLRKKAAEAAFSSIIRTTPAPTHIFIGPVASVN
jgi:hypothetical protein